MHLVFKRSWPIVGLLPLVVLESTLRCVQLWWYRAISILISTDLRAENMLWRQTQYSTNEINTNYHQNDRSSHNTLPCCCQNRLVITLTGIVPEHIVQVRHETNQKTHHLGEEAAETPNAKHPRGFLEGDITHIVAHSERTIWVNGQKLEQNSRKNPRQHAKSSCHVEHIGYDLVLFLWESGTRPPMKEHRKENNWMRLDRMKA